MLKAVIVDDEIMSIRQMSRVLSQLEYVEVIGSCMNSVDVVGIVEEKKPDIVFLDIEMPGLNGIEVAESLIKKSLKTKVIFVTAYSDYAMEAFSVYASGYLLKPVRKERLEKLLEHLRPQLSEEKSDNGLIIEDSGYVLQCLGRLELRKSNLPVSVHFRSAKVKELFAYYLHFKNRSIPREELIELLWHDLGYKNALSNLNTTHYQLKKDLSSAVGDRIRIEYHSGYYKIALNDIHCDVFDFEETFAKLLKSGINEDQLKVCDDIRNAYKRPYMEDVDATWLIDLRYHYENKYLVLSKKLCQYLFQQEMYSECIERIEDTIRFAGYDSSLLKILEMAKNKAG